MSASRIVYFTPSQVHELARVIARDLYGTEEHFILLGERDRTA